MKELPVTDNEHITLDWDCENVDEVARQIFEKEVEPFEYKAPKDTWSKILVKGKSTYKKQEIQQGVMVKCREKYFDNEIGKTMMPNETTEMMIPRAEFLESKGVVTIVNNYI